MPEISSSKGTFTSLSVRSFKFGGYSAQDKVDLFEKAVDAVKTILGDTSRSKPVTSIPELMHLVFDKNNHDPQLETIREALRSTTHFGFHTLSATGNKLLACLALVHDENCLGQDGYLNMAFTKSTIRSWFANSDKVDFDESALQNIHRSDTCCDLLTLGKNRLSGANVILNGDIQKALEANRTHALPVIKSISLDFDTIPPANTVKGTFNEVALGDMNGNSIRLLHELVQTGIVNIKKNKDIEWTTLMQDIDQNQANADFGNRLGDLLELPNKAKRLVLLGDLLCDRTHNDWFMLSIINFLHEEGQNFDIIFSNHDSGFVEYYLLNKDKSAQENYSRKKSVNRKFGPDSTATVDALEQTLNFKKELRPEFIRMSENYMKHLMLVSCTLDQQTSYSHAVINENMVHDMLVCSGCESDEIENMCFAEKCAFINRYVTSSLLTNLEEFQRVWTNDYLEVEGNSTNNPFYNCIWNIGPVEGSDMVSLKDRYCNMDIPIGVTGAVHGHCASVHEKYDTRNKVISTFRSRTAEIKGIALDSPAAYIVAGWNFLQEARKLYSGPGITAPLLYAQLEKIRQFSDAEIENKESTDEAKEKGKELADAIDLFYKGFEAVPANEDKWFYDFNSGNPNHPVTQIQEKLKSMPDYGKKKPISVLLKNDQATLKILMDHYTLSYESKIQELNVQLRGIINMSVIDTTDVSEPDKAFFPFHDSLHPIIDALTRTKKNYDADIERRKKAQAIQNHDASLPRVLDVYDQLIVDTVTSYADAKENNDVARTMAKQMDKLKRYISLDNYFGGRKDDRQGAILIFTA